jgi:hypothetical protein
MRQAVGYTLSGPSITMLSGSIPTPGDILQAWYRLPATGTPTIQFSENDTPAGIVDAANTTFTVQDVPVPASSLQIFRNGVLQKVGVDYTLNGKTITFMLVSVPVPGDVLQASYRR